MKNKNTLTIVLIVLIIIGLLGLTFIIGDKKETTSSGELATEPAVILANAQAESAAVKDTEKKDLIQINVEDYITFYQASTPRLVLIARPTCGYCQIAEPIIQNIAYEYDLDIYYLNTDNFTDEDQTAFITSDEFFKSGYGTPILLVVQDNRLVDRVDGLTDYAHYIDFFKRNGYIR